MDRKSKQLNATGKDFSSLLKFAAIGNVTAAISNRVARGDSVNAQDKDGLTVLMYAARKGNSEAVSLLISLGADPNVTNKDSQSALDLARMGDFDEVVRILIPLSVSIPDFHDAESEPLDIGPWVDDLDTSLPTHDLGVEYLARKIQSEICSHKPIIYDEEWLEVEISLPDTGSLRSRKEWLSEDDKMMVREAIYAGYANGSITAGSLEKIAADQRDRLDGPFLNRLMTFFGDLDFYIEDSLCDESSQEVFEYDEYYEEICEQVIGCLDVNAHEASWFFGGLINSRRDGELLTHDQEIQLGRKVEIGYQGCINELSGEPLALDRIIEDLRKVVNGSLGRHEVIFESAEPLDNDDNPDLSQAELDPKISDELTTPDLRLKQFLERYAASDSRIESVEFRRSLRGLNLNFRYLQHLISLGFLKASKAELCMQEALDARNVLVTSNLRLAAHISRAYSYSDLPFDDIVQEGYLGLIKAAEKYDYRKGFRFSTYATWWIRQAVSRMIQDKSRLIRLPVHIGEMLYKVRSLEVEFEGIPAGQRTTLIAERLGISVKRVERLQGAVSTILSLESDDPEDIQLIEGYDVFAFSEEESLSRSMLRDAFEFIFNSMDPREVEVLKRRVGWCDDTPLSLEAIGLQFGLTRERVRQIETKGIRALRKPSALASLGISVGIGKHGTVSAAS